MAQEGSGLALGFEITELRLGPPGSISSDIGSVSDSTIANEKKRKQVSSEVSTGDDDSSNVGDRKAPPKSQVVGWPPVNSYRRKNSLGDKEVAVESSKMYVKVSMDGAPFLRKVDLGIYKGYSDLAVALEKLFGCFGIDEALKDEDSSEYVPIYEDKDGDWMLAGDVPWVMFIDSCKRLRIMKRADAKGFGLQSRDFLKGISKKN